MFYLSIYFLSPMEDLVRSGDVVLIEDLRVLDVPISDAFVSP